MAETSTRPLVLACGALVAELRAVLGTAGLTEAVEVRYLPANLHNRPERIAPELSDRLDAETGRHVFVAYADCGTGGALDRLLERHPGVSRLPGAHCYEFLGGSELFHRLHDAEPGTFYLTDFLAKHFDALVWEGLGLDRHPELRDAYFGNYRRVVLLSQSDRHDVVAAAEAAATRLALAFEHRHVGLTPFSEAVHVGLGSFRKVA